MPVSLTFLVDNATQDPHLTAEHGLSVWVVAHGTSVLFDTGQSGAVVPNARRLGVPLERADFIVLSHGHYDHTGGLCRVLSVAKRAVVCLHPEATRSRFSLKEPGRPRPVGMAPDVRKVLATQAHRVRWTPETTRLAPHIGLTGSIPRRSEFEDVGGPFFLDREGRQPDDLLDDQALWIDTPRGAVVLLGCGHAGLVNTLDHVARLTATPRILAVVGGFHLGRASETRLAATRDRLRALAPEVVAPAHCTGERGVAMLRESLPGAWRRGAAGAVLRLGTASDHGH
jgi:7,8-dihydropterin-6-yl-methyl-4-(beta-D-ribofuranosyl)aminobenzene 5'-phosphate synthase